MKITNTKLTLYSLPLLSEWQSHSDSFDIRQGYLLQIEDDIGRIGYGDCAPLPSQGTETAALALKALESHIPRLTDTPVSDALEKLPEMGSGPAARCAIEMALLDLAAKQQTAPLHKRLNPESASRVKANANAGVLDRGIDNRISALLGQGYSILKLKVGIFEPTHELEHLCRICGDLPANIQLRLDANQAWDSTTAKSFLNRIRELPIESLEEPLAQPNINALKQLQAETKITLALDESISQLSHMELSQLQPLRRIILKPMVLGGLLPAMQLGQHARDLGIETIVTTTIDSAVGVWAATQLAAALDPESKLRHGVATSDWLQQDLGAGPGIKNGCIAIPQTSGLGFIPYD